MDTRERVTRATAVSVVSLARPVTAVGPFGRTGDRELATGVYRNCGDGGATDRRLVPGENRGGNAVALRPVRHERVHE